MNCHHPETHSGNGRNALTLFELLIVMAILSILVTLVIGLGRYADLMAKRHRAIADLGKWQEAIHRYYEVLAEYPDSSNNGSITNLLNVRVRIGGTDANTVYVRFGEQMSTLPSAIDPWGKAYQYVAATNRAPQSFDLYSCGPDQQGGTADDIRFRP